VLGGDFVQALSDFLKNNVIGIFLFSIVSGLVSSWIYAVMAGRGEAYFQRLELDAKLGVLYDSMQFARTVQPALKFLRTALALAAIGFYWKAGVDAVSRLFSAHTSWYVETPPFLRGVIHVTLACLPLLVLQRLENQLVVAKPRKIVSWLTLAERNAAREKLAPELRRLPRVLRAVFVEEKHSLSWRNVLPKKFGGKPFAESSSDERIAYVAHALRAFQKDYPKIQVLYSCATMPLLLFLYWLWGADLVMWLGSVVVPDVINGSWFWRGALHTLCVILVIGGPLELVDRWISEQFLRHILALNPAEVDAVAAIVSESPSKRLPRGVRVALGLSARKRRLA